MDKNTALENLLNKTASEEDVELLKRLLDSGEISIGGNVNHSVIIIGSGNTVELTPEALDRLNARPLLGNLDRDLTGTEIALGLERLASELPQRAPILLVQFQEQSRRLRPLLKTSSTALSESARSERIEALSVINSLCLEALDISFNALCLGAEPPEYDSRSPFRGLESFRPEDSEFFFGREALIKKLVGKINSYPFLAVLGASGSGKSSLVMAGLIPALGLDYVTIRPGTDPLGMLVSAKAKALIVADQFEELFTLTRDESIRKDFIVQLLALTTNSKVIITLRTDFLGEVAAYRTLSDEIQNHLEIIPPMNMDELRRAMEGQAGQVGLRFEADLSQQILDDVEGEPGAMPLLQHALWELWNRRHGRNLRASEYRAFGGVKQAITSTAEKVYGECTKAEQEQIRDIFIRLTRLDNSDEGRDTRRRVAMSDLIPSGQDAASITLLLDKLANARLIVKAVNEDKTEVEVAHEALIRHWERLRLWLNEDREGLQLRQHLRDSADQWEKRGRETNELYRGERLKQIQEWKKKHIDQLNPLEGEFLKASIAGLQHERRSVILRWVSFAGASTLVLLTIFLALTGRLNRFIYRPLLMEWIEIPTGEFLMGSSDIEIADALKICPSCDLANEQPQHLVYLDAYQIGKYEVTNKQYYRCVQAGVCNRPTNKDYEKLNFQNYPVTDITWEDALNFCEWNGGSLPTEAEWEKAARGNVTNTENTRVYPWGNQWDPLKANVDTGDSGKAMPVGSYSPIGDSIYGAADMSGNVWEWVMDWYDKGYYAISPSQNPAGAGFGKKRTLRGGSFVNSVSEARSSFRASNNIGNVSNDVGFRCVK